MLRIGDTDMKVIIDATTGTVVSADDCYIVDLDTLNPEDAQLLDMYSDSEASELARRVGKSVVQMGNATGWGDNAYAYTVSYSPLSLRDEAEAYLDGGVYSEGDREYDAIVWAKSATVEELTEVSQCVMSWDSIWDGFRENFMEALMIVWNDKHNGLDSTTPKE